MVADTTTWHKPPFARHAAIYEALADILEGATPSAVKLALYLYRTCIGGKPEEIDIHCIPLGEKRATPVRSGKPYSPNTRRAALRQLEKLGLVKILKNYGRGIFRIAVQHLGDVRPFTHTNSKFQKLSKQSKNKLNQPKIEQIKGSNPDGAVLFTENKKEQQDTENVAAIFFNFPKEEEDLRSSGKKPELVNQIKSKNTELNKNSKQELKTGNENKYSAPTAECLSINLDNSQAVDVAVSCTPEQIGLTSKPQQKLLTKLNNLNNPTISAAKSTIPTNKAFPLSPEIPSPVTPQLPEIVKAVAFTNPDASEIVEAVPIANPDATEIVKTVPIANFDATEIVEAVPIANLDATEIVEAVTRATGGINPELKICVLQHSLNEIQAAINLLQLRSQTKQISNPSGWLVDCLRGRWWEKTNSFQNSTPTNVVSSPTPTGSSPTPTNSSAEAARTIEDYIDPHYMPLKTHRDLCDQFQELGKEAFGALGIQQQIYLQWMQRFPQQLKQILNKLSTN
jgi:hypothetical protein